MKFTVSRDGFSNAVQWTSRAVHQRPAIPILGAIRLETKDEELELSSFDYEVSALSRVEAKIEQPGQALVQGKMLSEIAKNLPSKDVTVELEDKTITVSCGRARFSLGTMILEDYPELPALPEMQGTIDAQKFTDAINQVSIATSKDDTLPLLMGVRIEIEGSKLTLLATDRYRLALKETTWTPNDPNVATEILVKSKTLTDVARNLTTAGDINIHLNTETIEERSSIIGFNAGERQATSSLMEGQFPPVRNLFPTETPLKYVCNRLELLEAVKRVSLVVERKTPVHLVFNEGELKLETGQKDNAQAEESLGLVSESEELRTAFNNSFLQEGIAAFDTEFISFGFVDAKKAAVLLGQREENGPTEPNFKYLLMPIQFGM